MSHGEEPAGLQLSEEEAYALLVMCLMSPHGIDKATESALRKLAEYCAHISTYRKASSLEVVDSSSSQLELKKAGS
jgi:hypothetical protein